METSAVQIEYETLEKLEQYLGILIDQGYHPDSGVDSIPTPLLLMTILALRDGLALCAQKALNSSQPEKLTILLRCLQELEDICTLQSIDPSDEAHTLADLLSNLSAQDTTHADLHSTQPSCSTAPSLTETCPICFEDFLVSQMRAFMVCKVHRYCRICLNAHLETCIRNADLDHLRCPHPACEAKPTESEIQGLLDEPTFQLYLRLVAKHTDEKIIWCPNPLCQATLIGSQEEAPLPGYRNRKSCPACATLICLDCRRLFHGSLPCDAAVTLRSTQRAEDVGLVQWLTDRGDRVKLCPRCREAIEKTDGWYDPTFSFGINLVDSC